MSLTNIKGVANFLRKLGRYGKILDRYDNACTDRSIFFEMFFAYWLEVVGVTPVYEYPANPNNEKTVDFFVTYDGINIQMELVRVEDGAYLAVNPSNGAAAQIGKLPIFSCLTYVKPAL